jgi:hypothetical protein
LARTQFVALEALDQIGGVRLHTVEPEAFRHGHDEEIVDDFALRRQERRIDRAAVFRALNVVGDETLQKRGGVGAFDLNDGAVFQESGRVGRHRRQK